MEVCLSQGNTKLGRTLNVSLLPIVTCNRKAGCAKREHGRKHPTCYACKFVTMRPEVRQNWTANTELAKRPSRFFRSLYRQLAEQAPTQYRPLFFRWFVGGDCPSKKFATDVIATAFSFPTIRFLCFTKRYEWFNAILDTTRRPQNLALIYSAWPGLAMPNPQGLPVAWMDDGTDDRIPANAMHCQGTCESCGACWSLYQIKKDVVFAKH